MGGRDLRVPRLHLRHAERRRGHAVPRQSRHGRVQPPVPRAALEDRHRRSPESVLRRRQRRRDEGRAPREARGLHQGRLPRGGRDTRSRPGADGQEGHHRLRLLRPRLRAAVARHQRAKDPLRREDHAGTDDGKSESHADLAAPEREPGAHVPEPTRRQPSEQLPARPCRLRVRDSLAPAELAKACWAGGTVQIYINPTLPAGVTYEQVRTAARNAFAISPIPVQPTVPARRTRR